MNQASEDAAGRKHAAALLVRARFYGIFCAVLFGLAALTVLDGLQTLMRHDFNRLDLVPGESLAVSGSLPQGAETYTDLKFTVEGSSALRFTPLESFKGFWFGGLMWRGEVTAAPGAAPGRATLTIIDLVPAKKVAPADANGTGSAPSTPSDASAESALVQNPMLVHHIYIHADEAARRSAELSLLLRFTGIPPFVAAVFFFACALVTGFAHWRVFGLAERALAVFGIFFVHGVKTEARGTVAAFSLSGRDDVGTGQKVRLLDVSGQAVGSGTITEITRNKGFALFPPTGRPPRYGRLVTLE